MGLDRSQQEVGHQVGDRGSCSHGLLWPLQAHQVWPVEWKLTRLHPTPSGHAARTIKGQAPRSPTGRQPSCSWAVRPGPSLQSTVSLVPTHGANQRGWGSGMLTGRDGGVLSWLPLHSQGTGPSAHLKAPQTCAGHRYGPGCLDKNGLGTDRGSMAQQEWGLARGSLSSNEAAWAPVKTLQGTCPSMLPTAVTVSTAPSAPSPALLAFWTALGLPLCEKGRLVLCTGGGTHQLGTQGHRVPWVRMEGTRPLAGARPACSSCSDHLLLRRGLAWEGGRRTPDPGVQAVRAALSPPHRTGYVPHSICPQRPFQADLSRRKRCPRTPRQTSQRG